MGDFFPLLLAAFLIVATFISAMNNGVVKLMASGLAALVLLITLGLGVQMLPALAKDVLDVELTWKATFGISCLIAVLGFVISRLILGWILRRILGPDSWFHWMVDGIPGGILSFVPSLIMVFFLFNCFRIGGTVLELNHIASLSQKEVAYTTTKLPEYPLPAQWRNSIERIPLLPEFLDLWDPFSNRANRNAAALVLAKRSKPLQEHLIEQPETALLLEAPGLLELSEKEDLVLSMVAQERVALVTHPEIREFVSNFPELKSSLNQLEWEPFLNSFVEKINSKTTNEISPSEN